MFKSIILSILFVLISFPALSEEKERGTVTELNLVSTVSCASSKEMKKIFSDKDIVFTGMISQSNIVKVFINEVNSFVIIMENAAGLACIYFTGGLGVLKEKAEKSRSKINGKYLYN